MANTATLRIRRVKCRDEMGGKWREKLGNDEIKCAVFSADLRGSTKNSGRVNIYDNFDDGDVKSFDPPKEVVTLDLAGAVGEVELAFTVILIESQLTEGEGLQKAWEEWVKVYEESLKDQLSKRQLTVDEARSIAKPGYLKPVAAPPRVSGPGGAAIGSFAMGGATMVALEAASTGGGTGGSTAAVTADEETKKKEEEKKQSVGDAFIAALITAAAIYTIKFAGSAVKALIKWAQDKFFAPIAIKAKIDASTAPENVPANGTGVAEFRGHDGIYEMEWDILVR